VTACIVHGVILYAEDLMISIYSFCFYCWVSANDWRLGSSAGIRSTKLSNYG
jgi:hypothetical protein